MSDHKEVVTPERFSKGFSYKDYVAQVQVNKERFEEMYEEAKLSPEAQSYFANLGKKEGGPRRVLVLGEDWCPDVFTNMPIVARIAEAGGYEMRVFPRDANRDIMDLYLNNGNMSIPAVVFYNEKFDELGRWIERPATANKMMQETREQLTKEGKSSDEIMAEVRKRVRVDNRGFLIQETIREIEELFK